MTLQQRHSALNTSDGDKLPRLLYRRGQDFSRSHDVLQRRANFMVHHAEKFSLGDQGLAHCVDCNLTIQRNRGKAATRTHRVHEPHGQHEPTQREGRPQPAQAQGQFMQRCFPYRNVR